MALTRVKAGVMAVDSVATASIVNDAVNADKLASNSVVTASIVDSTGSDGVTTSKLANDCVTADKLASNAVVTASVVDANITLGKLSTAVQGRLGLELDSATAKTAAFNAAAGKKYYVDTTSSAITATLPASPTVGDNIQFIDLAGTFATNNLTLGRNGKKVLRAAADGVVDQNNFGLIWEFTGDTHGWLPIA